jgi:predicted permease
MGRTIHIDGNERRVVGVLPREFELPTLEDADVLFPQQLRPHAAGAPPGSRTRFLRAYGRLKPGVSVTQTRTMIQPVFAEMLKSVPERFRSEVSFLIRPLHERQMGEAKRTAWLLLSAVAVLLLIACVSVTNLLLARVAARQREFTVRAALGAGRLRIARLALTEGILISLASCLLGLAIAWTLLKIFVSLAPRSIPKIEQAAIDPRVGAAALAFALAAGIAIALSPGIAVIRLRLLTGTRTVGAIQPWVRFGLAAAQLALTVGLISGAALLLRSLWNFSRAPLAFETRNILVVPVTLGAAKYPNPEQRIAFFEQLLERASETPGTLSAAMTDSLPPAGSTDHMLFTNVNVEGRPPIPEGTGGTVAWRSVTPGYFRALGIPIVRGRDLDDSDVAGQEHTMMINESLARKLFPDEDPVGQRVGPGRGVQNWYTVAGVVRDTRDAGPAQEPEPRYFLARRGGAAGPLHSSFLVLRTSAGAAVTGAFLREAIARLDPQLPVVIQTMEQRVSELAQRPRFIAWLLAAFAGVALLLAAAGLHGVVAYLVTQRSGDIGVRMALGATPGRIARHTVGEAAVWVACGIALGQFLAYAGGRLMESQLFGVEIVDPLSWLASLTVLIAAVGVAVLRPALRAARIDPAQALRAE